MTHATHVSLAYHISDAIRVSGATRTAIYEAMRSGRLPYRKLGRRTLIMHSDLQAWLDGLPAWANAAVAAERAAGRSRP